MDLVRTDFNLPELFRMAEMLMHAKGMIPNSIRHPGEIVAIVMTGKELGIPPMAALRSVSIVNGKPVIDAAVQLGLMVARGVKFRWVADGSAGEAILELTRPGHEPFVSVFNMEMAKRAGLAGKDNWKKHTEAMLRARAISAGARAYMPEVLAGVYVPGELDDETVGHAVDAGRDAVQRGADMAPAPALGQGGAPAAAALPASTGVVTLADELVANLYETTTRKDLEAEVARAATHWASFKRDEKLAIKGAREHAERRVAELEAEAREAAAAEAALSAKADAAIEGQGAPDGGAVDVDAPEPGSSDEPDLDAPHEPDAGFGGAEAVQP